MAVRQRLPDLSPRPSKQQLLPSLAPARLLPLRPDQPHRQRPRGPTPVPAARLPRTLLIRPRDNSGRLSARSSWDTQLHGNGFQGGWSDARGELASRGESADVLEPADVLRHSSRQLVHLPDCSTHTRDSHPWL